MSAPPVVLVTGARVGIGRATAVAFGELGMRVAVTSRRAGEPTAAAVEAVDAAGGQAMAVALDLADRGGVDAAVAEVAERWGGVDILVNNALCDQDGAQSLIAETDFDALERMIVGEIVNTTYLTRQVLALTDGPVTVIDVGSAAADFVPPAPVGRGGFAFSYAASKAAVHRRAPFLELEYGDRVRAFAVDPGLVRTEQLLARLGDLPGAAPPEVPARVIRWLATDPGAETHRGRYLHAQKLAAELGLAD